MTFRRQQRDLLPRTSAGLTLVELVVIIAVVGFFAAMAIPTFKDIVSESMDATAKRNAQNIAMVASVAEVMGSGVFENITTLDEAVDLIISGTDSRFSNAGFAAGEISEEEKLEAMKFLRFEQGVIVFSADPSDAGTVAGGRTGAPTLVTSPIGNF